jgi:hypothetical protein
MLAKPAGKFIKLAVKKLKLLVIVIGILRKKIQVSLVRVEPLASNVARKFIKL